jgi:hypothetical protein
LWDRRAMGAYGCILDQDHDLLHEVPVGPDCGDIYTALKGFEATEFRQPCDDHGSGTDDPNSPRAQ